MGQTTKMPQGKLGKTKPMQKRKRGVETKEIQKNKRKPKPRKKTKEGNTVKKLHGNHAAMTESLLADRVLGNNQKLRIIKPDQKLIKDVKAKESKRKEKYG